jgi:hypothetical protein
MKLHHLRTAFLGMRKHTICLGLVMLLVGFSFSASAECVLDEAGWDAGYQGGWAAAEAGTGSGRTGSSAYVYGWDAGYQDGWAAAEAGTGSATYDASWVAARAAIMTYINRGQFKWSCRVRGGVWDDSSLFQSLLDSVSLTDNNTTTINTDPAIPEPTTLSLLTMSLLLVGRRWR